MIPKVPVRSKPLEIDGGKICANCVSYKPHDKTVRVNSKASGFYGRWCWDCYIKAQTPKPPRPPKTPRAQTPKPPKPPKTPEQLEAKKAAALEAVRRYRETPEGREAANAAARKYYARKNQHE